MCIVPYDDFAVLSASIKKDSASERLSLKDVADSAPLMGDVVSMLRNGTAVTAQASALAAGTVTPVTAATPVAAACTVVGIPFLQMIGGGLTVVPAIYGGKAALKDYDKACEHYTSSQAQGKDLHYANEELIVAESSIANNVISGAGGGTMIANGVMGIMSPDAGSLLGFTPVLDPSTAAIGGAVGGAVYGGLIGILGIGLLGAGLYNLRYIGKFEREFHDALKTGGMDHAIDLVETLRVEDPSALKRRIGDVSLPTQRQTPEEKIAYLQAVDKGIYTRKLRQQLNIGLGALLVLAGIAVVIAALVLTGGVAGLAFGFGLSMFAMLIGGASLSVDWNRAFEWLRDKRYTESPDIQSLIQHYNVMHQESERLKAIPQDWWNSPIFAPEIWGRTSHVQNPTPATA